MNNRVNLRKHSVIPRRTEFAPPVLFRGTVIDLVLIESAPMNTIECVLPLGSKSLIPLLNSISVGKTTYYFLQDE